MKYALRFLTITTIFFITCNAYADNSTTMNNKTLVTNFFQLFSDGETEEAFDYLSDDASWWVPGDLPFSGTKTKAEYLQIVGNIQTSFPEGLSLELTSMTAEGDKVAAEVSSLGQHVNGKTYTNKYHFLIEIKNNKMINVKEYMDTLHLFQLISP